jgi:phosphatidate cytidylyltransferase
LSSPYASLPKRVAVAAAAIPLILWLAFQGGYYFFAFVALASSLALFEFYGLAEAKGAFPLKTLGLLFGFIVNLAFVYDRLHLEVLGLFASFGVQLSMFSLLQFVLFVLLVFFLCVALLELFRQKDSPMLNAGMTILGVLFVSLFFGTLIEIRELFPFGFPVGKFFPNAVATEAQLAQINQWGGYTVISIFVSIWMCDTAAYFGGTTLGRHKLFQRVSPNKTWEGAVFGFVFAVLTMIVAQKTVLDYLALNQAIVMGSIVGICGQLGDLVESRFKRDAGVKDSSSFLPGHGGVYDRFDSLIFVSPILYLYIDFVILS